jgi:hypothetical protein
MACHNYHKSQLTVINVTIDMLATQHTTPAHTMHLYALLQLGLCPAELLQLHYKLDRGSTAPSSAAVQPRLLTACSRMHSKEDAPPLHKCSTTIKKKSGRHNTIADNVTLLIAGMRPWVSSPSPWLVKFAGQAAGGSS